MTEKVKITQEVADAIEKYKSNGHKLKEFVVHGERGFHGYYEPLKGLPIDDMARLLYEPDSYEIESEYKVGDWVVKVNGEKFKGSHLNATVVTRVGSYSVVLRDARGTFNFDFIRHATPEEIKAEKERRKWAEIEEGDVLRKIPMAHEIAIYQGNADDVSILVKNDFGQHLWKKSQVELYAKKVGDAND